MRIIVGITSLIILIGGILLQLNAINTIPLIVIGAIGVVLGIFNSMITGLEKFITSGVSAIALIIGILPYVSPLTLPYPIILIAVGAIGLIYGFSS